MKIKSTILGLLLLIAVATLAFTSANKFDDDSGMVSYIVDPKIQELHFYWKNKEGERLGSINRLKKEIERKNQTLVFATNGGMYSKNFSPQGLFIQNRKIITPLDTADGAGNFYMKPNGIFYITTENVPFVCETRDFMHDNNIKYATQSGPLLLLNGKLHPAFKEGSTNLNVRNGVGILPNNTILFAMSKEKVNLYDFASYFKRMGCKNALYLDGYVSRTYLPEKKWVQTDGNFGVMIGVVKKN